MTEVGFSKKVAIGGIVSGNGVLGGGRLIDLSNHLFSKMNSSEPLPPSHPPASALPQESQSTIRQLQMLLSLDPTSSHQSVPPLPPSP